MSSEATSAQQNCGICLISLTSEQGIAIFTAECSHCFHYPCIANNVHHGNLCCPICQTKWDKNNVPFQVPPLQQNIFLPQFQIPSLQQIRGTYSHEHPSQQDSQHFEQPSFSDDEPLPPSISSNESFSSKKITINTRTESAAICAAESNPNFPALVSIRAPPLRGTEGHERTPIDLVTVLDVSGSMSGTKLDLVKCAVKFVIENLRSSDRFSIVSFSSNSKRVFPLLRMTAEGRESAILAVESLRAGGGTNIVEGLKKGVQVLEDRRQRNPVASILLLSDGVDTYNRSSTQLLNQLPAAIHSSHMEHEIPVHTFGFGSNHDANIMHAISDASGGIFSFIESVEMIQDGFALCIGGLLSVVAQEVRLTVRSASFGVKIVSIPSGRHVNEISDEGEQGVIHVGNMYAEEEKQFLVYMLVSQSSTPHTKTSLLDVLCLYKDPSSKDLIQVQGERAGILRPQVCTPAEEAVSLDVDRQRNRILVSEAIAEAQKLADMGNLEGAQALLAQRKEALLTSPASLSGDSLNSLFETELKEMIDRMASVNLYNRAGRGYALSKLSSHSQQRAVARVNVRASCLSEPGARSRRMCKRLARVSSNVSPGEQSDVVGAFETPAMVRMLEKSQKMNEPGP